MLKYAGIGSRKTPENVINMMTKIAAKLSKEGWLLRSGHAIGANQAFERGQVRLDGYEIHLPFENYNNGQSHQHGFIVPAATKDVVDIARQHHPVWDQLSPAVKLMMCRNVTIVLGEQLDDPVDMVICWTPFGRTTGGTGQAMRIASTRGIPVFNLANDADFQPMCEFANRLTEQNVSGLEDEPIERVAARLVIEINKPTRGRRLNVQAIRAHLFNRAGNDAYRLIQEAEEALRLLDPGPIIQQNKGE